MYKYKTKDGNDLVLTGVGATVNGLIESDHLIENPNLVLVEDQQSVVATEAPQANVVTNAAPVETTPVPVPTEPIQTNQEIN